MYLQRAVWLQFNPYDFSIIFHFVPGYKLFSSARLNFSVYLNPAVLNDYF